MPKMTLKYTEQEIGRILATHAADRFASSASARMRATVDLDDRTGAPITTIWAEVEVEEPASVTGQR